MPLTNNQETAFFQDADSMGLPQETRERMQGEGITHVSDLARFKEKELEMLAKNLQRPSGPAEAGHPQSFRFPAISQARLKVACECVRYYQTVGRELTAANIRWPVLESFETQWDALTEKKEKDPPTLPEIDDAKGKLPILKWTEVFRDYCEQHIGSRTILLSYVIRENVEVPVEVPTLAQGQPHSTLHGSVKAELVARASHNHAAFRDDNEAVYHLLVQATMRTQYSATIKPFQRTYNGRGAWLALLAQYAGNDKWETVLRAQEKFLHNGKWKGNSNQTLERFIALHRNAYVQMQACSEYVTYQLPNEHSRVGYLLQAIESSDSELLTAKATVQTDEGEGGMRHDFERTAAHLTRYDPVAKKRGVAGTKRPYSVAAFEETGEVKPPAPKKSIGETGVHLRWHTQKEYAALNDDQKHELYEWRQANPEASKQSREESQQSNGSAKGKGGKQSKKLKKQINSLVKKKVKQQLAKADKKESDDDEMKAYIISLVEEALKSKGSSKKVTISAAADTPTEENEGNGSILKNIVARAKKGNKD